MNADEQVVRDLFAPHDPAAGTRPDPERMDQARAGIQTGTVPASVRGGPARGRRPLLLGLAAGVATLLLTGVTLYRDPGTAEATPPPAPLSVLPGELDDAGEELRELAERAAARPATAGEGEVAYVRLSRWNLTLSQDLDTGEEGWGIAPVDEQVWRSPDHTGRVVERPRPAEHLAGDRGPIDALFEPEATEYEWSHPDEGLQFSWAPGTLAEDPDTLRRQLAEGDGIENAEVDTAEVFYGLQRLYQEMPVSPGEQERILRMLAEDDGVRLAGQATDREGRTGVLFVAEDRLFSEGGTLQRRIMFDADTGMPLYHETVAMEGDTTDIADGSPVVNEYVVLVESAWVREVGDLP
ncbi:CU044_5270 family protein [Marinactinospora thermotolerans]|uniref:CU044_5270 family protein n=1 Tax=Marinactinospora thermotolerans DSM 45154 TaxID=1122192 RepID=A0A1T4RAW5_9ACTN|nr:CU044_5270 family protein [Marinactinospora thermotolerans]SKA12751.1 hypothetical protein SAMN02745673_02641 [Marinactinospora thermotolerans DSM 45154]